MATIHPPSSAGMRIDRRFNGPPGSANGGIACGLLAAHVGAPVTEVTLRKPPPLDTTMRVEAGRLYDGEVLVAEARAGTVDLTAPTAVGVAEATAAATSYGGLVDHPFPTCFVCGPARTDGLALTASPVGDDGVVAAVWTPYESSQLLVWAALDCPGAWAADLPGRPMVLGRMACRIDALPAQDEPHVVQGWLLGGEGRKVHTGSALYAADGTVLAVAQATWITLA